MIGPYETFLDLPKVQCPVDLACGGPTASFGEDVLEAMSARLARSRITVFHDLGHFGPLEQPAVVAESMIQQH